MRQRVAAVFAFVCIVAVLCACKGSSTTSSSNTSAAAERASPSATDIKKEPAGVEFVVAYGSEKKAWLEEQVAVFNAAHERLASGETVSVKGKAMGSGEAMQDILDGRLEPAVFSPASSAYVTLINDAWMSRQHPRPIALGAESIVISPIVIAMWRPMAEALGWPKKSLGWSDILKISQNARGWEALGRPEWGSFKLGHTHPEYSNSGLLAVLAEAYAGAAKTRKIEVADLATKKTRGFVEGIEGSIVHYGKSTGFFSEKMLERGPPYLSAAVLYENLVVESYGHPSPSGLHLVAIYPREGTFWSDHPYSILDAPWVTPKQKQAAERFFAFLKGRPAQERALALGFRPADPALAVASPIDADHGCDPKQPQTLLEVPNGATLQGLLTMFREVKKPSEVVLVFDKSGSMAGKPLAQAKAGARAFLEALSPRDQASLEFFDNKVYPGVGPFTIAEKRAELLSRVDDVIADGGTALYQAVADAYRKADERSRSTHDRIRAIVVMTDGKDESSEITLQELKRAFPKEGQEAGVKIFTIAYGSATSQSALAEISEAGGGSHSEGTVENIVQVYRDIASFF